MNIQNFVLRLLRALMATALGLTLSAQAMTFTPIEMDFSPTGRGATQIFRLENNTAEPAAVEMVIKSRAMAINGDDVLGDADDQFSIFPPQLVLQPGQMQSVRVQYTGAASIDKERAFRLVVEQLPVDLGETPQDGGRMRLLVKYIASLYVVPRNVRALLSVSEAQIVKEHAKNPQEHQTDRRHTELERRCAQRPGGGERAGPDSAGVPCEASSRGAEP